MPQRKPLVLSVDDDRAILELIESQLTRAGISVLTAESGERALELLAQHAPDLVLMDVMMPGMDGYETCARMQASKTPLFAPIVYLTARESEEDRARALALGAVDYLTKPITKQQLLETVRKHLETQQRWANLRPRSHKPDALVEPKEFERFKDSLAGEFGLSPSERERLISVHARDIYAVAVEHGMPEPKLARAIATFLGVSFVPRIDPTSVPLGVLPPSFCKANLVCPAQTPGGAVFFVVANPFDDDLLDLLAHARDKGSPTQFAVAEPAVILQAFVAAPSAAGIADLERTLQTEFIDQHVLLNDKSISEESKPLIQFVNKVIETAFDAGASDIHIEPWEKKVVIRYRIDGELHTVNTLRPARLIRPLVVRIKIMSNLDIAESRLPQDGRIAFGRDDEGGRRLDLRVSVIPSNYGEKIVMRVLDLQKSMMPLQGMGFSARHLAIYRDRLKAPYGMILHVGPTGSGKSMTLYAALNEMDKTSQNIQTIEDPIEYTLAGITQMQVNPDIGLTFPKALRAYVRQDPDVILVGEIRDLETARTAAEAALTGHLLLSTLHTNDAATTITRLMEMGVEPFLVGSSLVLICAQRLLRRLCQRCRVAYRPTAGELGALALPANAEIELYRPVGCAACSQTGYKGRIACHELLVPDDAMRQLINRRANALELKRLAVAAGMTTLYWDAMEKVREGITSLDDVLANVKPDEFETQPTVFERPAASVHVR